MQAVNGVFHALSTTNKRAPDGHLIVAIMHVCINNWLYLAGYIIN